jgi:Xaa-Pro aminopeptidase
LGVKRLTSRDSLNSLLKDGIVDAFWISSLLNVRYLTGFSGTSAYLLLLEDKEVLITDKRYEERVKGELSNSGVEIEIANNSYLKALNKLLLREGIKKLGVEANNLSYLTFLNARRVLNAKLVPFNTESLRRVKSEQEVQNIRKAVEISEKAFLEVLNKIRPGIEEKKIAFWLESLMKEMGAERVAFDIIVASGERSSMPHAQTSRRKIEKGEFLLIDWGCVYEGYHADITRTLVLGKPAQKQKEIFSLVKEAQDFAFYNLKEYRKGKTIYEKIKKFFAEKGRAEGFMHSLGHGIGLEIHESPKLGEDSVDKIVKGMVFTLEPALYFPGFGGARLEDDVIMRSGYAERITTLPRELIEV